MSVDPCRLGWRGPRHDVGRKARRGPAPRLGLGITLLPSDIARAFARTGEFGSYAEAEDPNYYWFPIVDAAGQNITYPVALTYRIKSHPLVEHVVTSIKGLLDEDAGLLDELTGRYPPPPPSHLARSSA